jgi:ribosomal silencing factor RsfS
LQSELEVNGTITTKQLIIANENQKQDVTAMLNELKNEIAQLKEQLNQITKN